MEYVTISDGDFDRIDFTPTIIVGFYRDTYADRFQDAYRQLKNAYPDVDVIGCSSAGNIANEIPYVETKEQFPIVYLVCNMEKDAFRVDVVKEHETINFTPMYRQMILLSSLPSGYLESILSSFSVTLKKPKIFGGVAGVSSGSKAQPSLFCNGVFYDKHIVLWGIDAAQYAVEGMSIHLFRPAGIPLEVTKAEGNTVLELNHLPVLDVLEEIVGKINDAVVGRFGYPFFLQKHHEIEWREAPLASIVSVNREDKSVSLYRPVEVGEYVKVGIMLSRQDQLRRLGRLYGIAPRKSMALLFHCIGIKENLKMMEYLYLEEIKHHIDVSFTGVHTFGEIGLPAAKDPSDNIFLHNQTISIAMISEKDKA